MLLDPFEEAMEFLDVATIPDTDDEGNAHLRLHISVRQTMADTITCRMLTALTLARKRRNQTTSMKFRTVETGVTARSACCPWEAKSLCAV